MKRDKIEKHYERFNTHKATLVQNTERYLIIDWRRADGSGDHYVNYIFDKLRGSLIVSGDLGDSVATWFNKLNPSDVKKWVKNDIGYYISKFQTASDLYYFELDDIVTEIKEELDEYCKPDDLISAYNKYGSHYADTEEEVWENLKDELSSCIYGNHFYPSDNITDFISEIDPDYFEWLYNCGKHIHPRVYMWAEGFYRACNQLGI